jgi:2-polyprenyl-6-methoxyphenol hydroxylase-like FAD-dependent oxidoreductase
VLVLIVGGGIGGLAAAIGLSRTGHEVRVFERAPRISEVGAGISLSPNATRALNQLGMGQLVSGCGLVTQKGGLFNWRGELLSSGTSALLAERFGAPAVVFHRADLIDGLLRALPPNAVSCDAACEDFVQDDKSVALTLADGTQIHGDVLIGADGIHSMVRRRLGRPSTPRYSGYAAWRGVIKLADAGLPVDGDYCGLYVGRGSQFGITLLPDERVYWFGTENCRADSKSQPKDAVERFSDWAEPVRRILRATDEKNILRNDIFDFPPLSTWGQGRVTLLGDAAHATTPNLGQGGCMALEDAVVLSHSLKTDPANGLRLYECQRIQRTARAVRESRRLGKIMQIENTVFCWLRDQALKRTSLDSQLDRLAWLFEYDALRSRLEE